MPRRKKRVKPNGTLVTSGGMNVSDGEEWLGRSDHPLLNDVILETLFGFVRRCDLKACRGVSKKWNLRTIPHMRAIFKVTIHGTQTTEQNDKEGNEDTRRFEDFLELFSKNELGIPFAKFQLGRLNFSNEEGQQFLELCGETAKEIDFMYPESNFCEIEDVFELLKSCPNLKVLGLPPRLYTYSGSYVSPSPDPESVPRLSSMEKMTFQPAYMIKYCPTIIRGFLTAVSTVSEIVVHNNANDDVDRNGNPGKNPIPSNITTVLNCIDNLGRESSIQSLSLHEVRGHHIKHLRRMAEKEKGLKLKSLRLERRDYSNTEAFDSAQIQLTSVLRNTLQQLSVGRSTGKSFMDFPAILNLKSLTFRNFPRSHTERVDLNEKFPALETLDLDVEWGWGTWNKGFSQFQSCKTLKALRVGGHANLAIGFHTFRNILRVLPSLKKLDLKVQNDGAEILRQIWKFLRGLESLTIGGCIGGTEGLELDSVFTGIPTETLKEILHSSFVRRLDRMKVQARRDWIHTLQFQYCRFPSIQNLTKLTHLNVGVTGGVRWNRTGHLTDLTAYFAFYSMQRLRHFDVKECMLTGTWCERLKNDLGLETWSFQNSDDTHIIPPFLLH